MERSRKTAGLLCWQRGAYRRDDPAFVGSAASPPRLQPGGRKWLVTAYGWRPEFLLEKQSLPHQSLYRRRRLQAPAMGGDRSGQQDPGQRHTDRMGRALRHALLGAILDR